ncbi:MAG: DUF3368 domain-containing protein [Dehalococcoidia bacterium]
MTAISNTSPLILFAKVGRLNLLRAVFDEILVPAAVREEIVFAGGTRAGAAAVADATWIETRRLAQPVPDWLQMRRVNRGEAEAIALALELDTDIPVLLDDRQARLAARDRGLNLLGSGGALVLAKERGLIVSVRFELDRLRAAGLYLGNTAYQSVLILAGEADR